MSKYLEVLTPQNCQVIFIDQQPQMAFGVQSIDRQALKNNVVGLAKAAKVFGIPTTITTVESDSFSGNAYPELLAVFPENQILERSSMNSWDDQNVRDSLAKHTVGGRQKIVAAGLWTEVCVATFALSCLHDTDYQIYMIADASGGTSADAHKYAMDRMMQAGIVPMTWQQVLLEWQRDWARRETYDAVMAIVREHSGAYGMGVDYAYTHVHKAPERVKHGERIGPEDYAVIQRLSDAGQLTIRLAYNLFTQKPKGEKQDFLNWTTASQYKQGTDYFRHNGAGEMLVFSAADFEDFRVSRPDMPPDMEGELEDVIRILVQNKWPWRLHATYDETISRALDVFENVNQDSPLEGLHWFFDHAETISDQSIDRIAALGGGIAVQHRMAYQGEYFVECYGIEAAEATPPVKKILDRGVRISAGTDATRVASYNPWVALSWLVTGMTVGGLRLYPQRNCLDRETALRMWTENVTWFSNEEGKKGRLQVGQFADLIVPDRDYFSCAENEIAGITSDLTMVGGRIVYGAGDFKAFDEAAPPPAMPDWSPARTFGGYGSWAEQGKAQTIRTNAAQMCGCANACSVHGHNHARAWSSKIPAADLRSFWGALGCACWAV